MRRAAAVSLALCLPALASAHSDPGAAAGSNPGAAARSDPRAQPGATAAAGSDVSAIDSARSEPRATASARSDSAAAAAPSREPSPPATRVAPDSASALHHRAEAEGPGAFAPAADAERGAPAAQHTEAPPLWGTWEWSGDAAERTGIEAAIARSTDGLFFIVKAIAKGRLRERSAIPQRYTLTLADGTIGAESTGNLPMRSSAEGGEVAYRSVLGEAVTLRQRIVGGALVQVLAADGGVRTNTFSLSPDGTTLTLRVVVASASLARPLDYQLTYRRGAPQRAKASG